MPVNNDLRADTAPMCAVVAGSAARSTVGPVTARLVDMAVPKVALHRVLQPLPGHVWRHREVDVQDKVGILIAYEDPAGIGNLLIAMV